MVWQFWGRAARGVLSVFAQGAFSLHQDLLSRHCSPRGVCQLAAGSHPAHDLGSDTTQWADAIGLTRGDHASWHSPDHRRGFVLDEDFPACPPDRLRPSGAIRSHSRKHNRQRVGAECFGHRPKQYVHRGAACLLRRALVHRQHDIARPSGHSHVVIAGRDPDLPGC